MIRKMNKVQTNGRQKLEKRKGTERRIAGDKKVGEKKHFYITR
jgi:hypothetical protein